MIKLLVIWSLVYFVFEAECNNFPASLEGESNSTFDFNKTIEIVINMAKDVEELNKLLAKLPLIPSGPGVELQIFDHAAATADLAQIGLAIGVLSIETAHYAYQIAHDLEDASEEEKRQLKEDVNFEKLSTQNKIMNGELDKIDTAIKDALKQITNEKLRNLFDEKVIMKMYNFLSQFQLMMMTFDKEAVAEFNKSCVAQMPGDIIFDMYSLTDRMFRTQLEQNEYDQNRFFNIAVLYLQIMNQYYIVYPYCSSFVYQSSISTTNASIIYYRDLINGDLKYYGNKMVKLSTSPDFLKPSF